jgi:hypothetical protein
VSLSGPPQLEQVRDSEMEVSRDVSEVPAPTSTGGAVSNRSGCDLVEDQDTTPVRDAGGGKARGPNGRYLPRDNPSPVPKPSRKFTHTSQNLKKRESHKSRVFFYLPSRLISYYDIILQYMY